VEAKWYKSRKCYRVWIPARMSENGKACRRRFEKEGDGEVGKLTVQELAEKFLARQRTERRSARTVLDDRWRLNAMTRALGHLRPGSVKRADILGYMEGIPPGTNRRSHYKTLRKLWLDILRYAPGTVQRNENPMAGKLFEEQLRHVRANISEFWRRSESDGRCRVNRETVLRADT
jgi:hypothetical protein